MRFGFDVNDPLIDWINEANAQFQEAFEWPWNKTLTQGVMNVGVDILPVSIATALPDAVFILIPGSDSIPLLYKPYHQFLSECAYSTPGQPKYYTKIGTDFSVSPIPSLAYGYNIYYTALAETFTSDANVPLIPSRYHFALVRGAAAIGLDTENQEERAATQQTRFQEIIDRAVTYYSIEQRGSFGRIRNVRD